MLGKLFKHEMKAMSRLLLPLYLVLAILTIMDRVVIYLDIFKGVLGIIPGLITFAYVVAIIAMIIVSFVIIVVRFYKNLMSDEGYLMFTLPVKAHNLINSKLFASTIWNVASVVGVIVSLLIVFSGSSHFKEIPDAWQSMVSELKNTFGSSYSLLIIEFIVMLIIGLFNGTLMIYVSIALGQFFRGHKILGSFAAYIGIYTVVQIITTVLTVVIGLAFKNIISDFDVLPQIIFPLTSLFLLALTVVYYWVTNFIFERKMNLD